MRTLLNVINILGVYSMVLMKTTWPDFWENSGDAPFSSIHNVMDIVKQYKNLCPINAIGIYISDQKNKKLWF